MKRWKRGLSLILVLGLILSLTACGGGTAPQETEEPQILGRYVEKSMSLPPCQAVYDMALLEDGRLRVFLVRNGGQPMLYTTKQDKSGWDDISGLPREIQESGTLDGAALAPDGSAFCYTWAAGAEGENFRLRFWFVDSAGNCRELPVDMGQVAASDVYLMECDFTDSGKLFAHFSTGEVREIDLATGALGENINTLDPDLLKISCAGESVYLLGEEAVTVHRDGRTAVLDGAMGQELLDARRAAGVSIPRSVFWQNADGYVFYTTPQGLFSYVPGGTIVEELISGNRSSLSEQYFLPAAMAGGEDNSFYVLGTNISTQETILYRYLYDENADTAPDNTLKVYVLHEDIEFPELISRYRATHPDIAVELEIGIRREDWTTAEGDALRKLNTKILAGEGPDLICLDSLNVDSYLDKGALLDLSDILAEADPTLTTVTECFARDGQICAIPTAFDIPLVYGPEHIISQIHDFDSLVSAVAQLKAERPDDLGILRALNPVQFADYLYDGCVSCLFNGDGTLNEEKLVEYFQAMKTLYDMDADLQKRYPDYVLNRTNRFDIGQFVEMPGSVDMVYQDCSIGFGHMLGMLVWYINLAARYELPGYTTGKLDVGSPGTFMPQFIMGVLASGEHPDVAKDCIRFMLTEEIQTKHITRRLPVNKAAFEAHADSNPVWVNPYAEVTKAYGQRLDKPYDAIGFELQPLTEEDRASLRRWVSELETPVPPDRTIRRLIMAQISPCLLGEISPEEAASAAIRTLNLYLAE